MKKISLLLFALIITFSFASNVFAWTGQYWGPTTGYVYDTYFRLCSATNCNTGVSNNRYDGWIDENLTESRGFIASHNINYSGEVQINNMIPNKFREGYLYSVTQYLCFTNTLTFNYPSGSYLGYSASDMESLTYEANVLTNYTQATLSETPFYGGNGTPNLSVVSFNKCQATQFIFKSTNNGNTFGIVYPSSGSGTVSVIGADIVALGNANSLSSSQVQSIVDNATSDMATTGDISDVKDSISNAETEIKNQIEDSTNKINDSITSSDVDSSTGSSFFEGFESDDYGLSDIITMPLDLINGLTSNTCVALTLTIPFVNKTIELPCMSSIYRQFFGDFFTIYQTITFGFVAYWVIVKIFALVKSFKDPNDDKVEVLDL